MFPCYHSWLVKKKLQETEISMAFFLGKWANVIWSWNNIFFNYSISPTLLPAFILDPWRKTFLYTLSIIGFISVFMAGDKMAGYVNWPLPTSPAPTSLSSFSLFPFQTQSFQYLPVLSKCYCKVFQWDDSKYVYINRGNTLGYILLTFCVLFLCHLFQLIQIQFLQLAP